jgi:chromatin remodeling complex protein RSC6
MNILISTNIANTRPTERTEDMNKSEDKALAHTKEIVQGIHTTEKNTREAKKIKHSDKRSTMFVTNQAAD